MKTTLLSCLIPIAVMLLPTLGAADVTLTFDTDTQGFTQGSHATAVEWNAAHGGSLALSSTPGWKPEGAALNLSSEENPALLEEWQAVLANGGTLSFRIIVRSTDLVGGFPNWFEMLLGIQGGDTLCCGANAGMPGLYGADGFPEGQTQTFDVVIPLQPSSSNENDKILQVNPNSGSHVIQFGLNSQDPSFESAIYFVDNFTIAANDGPVEVVIPELVIEPATPGLNIISSTMNQWDRQSVRTASAEYSWVGASGPVSYSFEIGKFPERLGYTANMYLVPSPGLAATATSPDWSEPVCAVITVGRHGDGAPGGWMRFAYKNDPANGGGGGSNGVAGHEYWVNDDGTGQGGAVVFASSAFMEGTWTVTIANNTAITLTTADGQTSTGSLLPATAQLFDNGLFVYIGAVPGAPTAPFTTNTGQNVILNSFSISGVATPLEIDFKTEALDTAGVEKAAPTPASVVQMIAGEASYWLRWNPPTSGFLPQQSTTLKAEEWTALSMTEAFLFGENERWRPLSTSTGLQDANNSFFRLERPSPF